MRTFVSGGDAAGKGLAAATRPRILFVVPQTQRIFLGIASLASVLKQHGYFIDMVSPNYRMIRRYLDTSREPVILAASVGSWDAPRILSLLARLRQDVAFFSVLGGPHPTAVPEVVEEEGVDAVCRGEGEFALLELAEAMQAGTSIENIANLWVKTPRGEIRRNDVRPPIDDLDSLPFPDREMWRPYFDTMGMQVMASRGCMFACRFCQQSYYNNELYKGHAMRVRRRSVENVVREIEEYGREFPLRRVWFVDSIFISSPQWLKEFCGEYQRRVRLPFECNVHPELVTSEIVGCLARAGCRWVAMGIETADEKVCAEMLGRRMDTRRIIDAARLIKSAGIKLRTSNIIGIDGDSLHIDWQTVKLNQMCDVDSTAAFPLEVYPGTDLAHFYEKGYKIRKTYVVFPTRKVRNMWALFGIAVEWPALQPLLKVAVCLPLTSLYNFIGRIWEIYCKNIRLWSVQPGDIPYKGVRFVRRCMEKRRIR